MLNKLVRKKISKSSFSQIFFGLRNFFEDVLAKNLTENQQLFCLLRNYLGEFLFRQLDVTLVVVVAVALVVATFFTPFEGNLLLFRSGSKMI